MKSARTFWLYEALVSLSLLVLVYDRASSYDAGRFIGAEFALFAVAFMATLLSGRAGRVLTAGVALGFAFATVLSLGTSGACGESDFICFSPGDVFAIGLIVSAALYPGWALGAGVGMITRAGVCRGVQSLEFRRMAIAREAQPVGSLQEIREAGLDREDLLTIYRNMLITRGIEERGHILYKQGKIPGSFYTGRGNEASSVGVATAMGSNDVGTPLHRDMGVHVTRGVEPWRIFAQYMGRVDGPTKGRDGNVHMADDRLGLIAMVSHLPAMLPVAVGCALAFRIRDERRVAVAWFGEGASARGDTHEAMNLAGVRRLPVVFICDNNQWAYSTPTHLEYATEHVADRAEAYGFDGVVVDGTDVLAVYREAKRAIEKARAGSGPTLLECLTLRMEGHAVHDDASYVPKEMFEEWAKRDPLERFRTWLRENADFTDEEEEEIRGDVKKLLNDALRRAGGAPPPPPGP